MAAPATATPAIEPPDADVPAPRGQNGHFRKGPYEKKHKKKFCSTNEIRVQSHLILVPRAYAGRNRRAPMVPKLRQSKERVSRKKKRSKKYSTGIRTV